MESVTERLHKEAVRRSRRAVKLWRQSQQAVKAPGCEGREKIEEVTELNRKAMENCVAALNTLTFLRRFDEETPLGKTFR